MSGSIQPLPIAAEIVEQKRSLLFEPSADPHLLAPFDHQPHTRIVFGVNSSERVGELCKAIGGQRALLVTDAGIVRAGHAEVVAENIRRAGVRLTIFSGVQENPGESCIEECVSAARAGDIDLIIGLGGGSSMDTAKGCNFILTNGGRMRDYWGVGKATKPDAPPTAGHSYHCRDRK